MDDASSTHIERSHELLEELETQINKFIKERDIPVTEVDWSELKEAQTPLNRPDREVQAGYLTLALASIDCAREAIKDNDIGRAVEQSLRAGVFATGVLDGASRQRLHSRYGGRQTPHKAFWEFIKPIVKLRLFTEQTDSEIAEVVVTRWESENPPTKPPEKATIRKRIGKWRAEQASELQ